MRWFAYNADFKSLIFLTYRSSSSFVISSKANPSKIFFIASFRPSMFYLDILLMEALQSPAPLTSIPWMVSFSMLNSQRVYQLFMKSFNVKNTQILEIIWVKYMIFMNINKGIKLPKHKCLTFFAIESWLNSRLSLVLSYSTFCSLKFCNFSDSCAWCGWL